MPATTGLRLSDGSDDGVELLAASERMRLEGVVSKRRAHIALATMWLVTTKTKAWREANKGAVAALFERPSAIGLSCWRGARRARF